MVTNKKGEAFTIPLISFLIVVIIGLIMSVIILKVVNVTLTPLSSQLGNISAQAGENVSYIQTKFIELWDVVIVIFLLINIILLFITAFLIDTHPVFLVLYIISCVFIMIFITGTIEITDRIFDSPQFVTEVSSLPFSDFFRNNLEIILLGIMILSGIVIYAKIRFFSSGGQQKI